LHSLDIYREEELLLATNLTCIFFFQESKVRAIDKKGMVEYSNGAIFASEAIGMCITIFFGESILANELLYATKGQGMGWGALALGFGLAFGFSIFMFGFISARLNPAFALAELVIGMIDGYEYASCN